MRKRPLCFLCLSFLIIRGIVLLLVSGQTYAKVPASSIFYENEQMENILVQGQVYKKETTSKNQILYLKNNSCYDSKILIYDSTYTDIALGQTIRVRGNAYRFQQARNPGNFDQSMYYARKGIYGFLHSEEILSVQGEKFAVRQGLYQLRERWKEGILQYMGSERGPVLCAMVLGMRGEMSEDTKELYQKNGMSHLLAISGLHISFIGLGIYGVLRKMGLPYTVSGIIAIGILSVYTVMVGMSISVFRAYIMLLLRIGADITGRVYDMLTALMLSAAMTIAYEPLYFTDAAFWMSYGAVLGIVIVLPEIQKLVPIERGWIRNGLTSSSINIVLTPILLWFYFEISVYSLIINMLILPLMPCVLGFGFFGGVAYFIWEPLAMILMKICDGLLWLFEEIGQIGAKLPFSQIVLGRPKWWKVLLYYILLIIVFWMLQKFVKQNKKILGVSIGISLYALSILVFVPFPNGKVQIAVLDVGQGDCIFIKGPRGKSYLVDGGSSDVANVGKYRIEPFLKHQGVRCLDYIFVSHGDSDHYSGIVELVERQENGVKISTIIFPSNYKKDVELLELAKMASRYGIRVAIMDSGQMISEGDLQITCLQPSRTSKELQGNEASMVLDVCFRRFDMLLTGDVEGAGETLLVESMPAKSYEVLKVSHHGSKNSTSESFLKSVKPSIGIISAGENNVYGHPHNETLGRLQQIKCKLYETAKRGAVILETDGDLIDILPSSI